MAALVRCDAVPDCPTQLSFEDELENRRKIPLVIEFQGQMFHFGTFYEFLKFLQMVFGDKEIPAEINIRSPENPIFQVCANGFYTIEKFKNVSISMPAPPIGPETNQTRVDGILQCMFLQPTGEQYSREQFRVMKFILQLLNH